MKNDGLDRANAPISNPLTPAERQRLVERHFEVMEQRRFEEDLRLARTMRAEQVLNRLAKG